jgi:hypothetical protein
LKVARLHDLNDPFELTAVILRDKRTRTALNEYKSKYDSQNGLLCFSANWASPVLWSHYAQKHQGICLGFDVRRDCVEWVPYDGQRVRRKLGDDEDPRNLNAELQRKLRCTKYEHWRYEEEIRMFTSLADAMPEGRLHFWPFSSGLELREVILGTLCELPLEEVRALTVLKYPRAITYRARLAVKSFNVVPRESTVP